jgi:isopentenyldiphosphate isomerase
VTPEEADAELLDLVDPVTGRPTGETARRDRVHREGLWHATFHLWIVRRGPPPRLLFQRRGERVRVAAGLLDVPVGGHYRAGESAREGVREVQEELGVPVAFDGLLRLGRRFCVHHEPGVLDHELVDVFLHETELDLLAHEPDPDELAGLYELTLDDALELFSGRVEACEARGFEVADAPRTLRTRTVRREDFVFHADAYPHAAAIQVRRHLDGRSDLAV